MEAVLSRGERLARAALRARPDGTNRARQALDDGTPLAVAVTIDGDGARVDFTGSGPQHPGNLNATPAIVRSAVVYVLRLLIGERLPLNEGLMRAVEVIVPGGVLCPDFSHEDDPARCPAVVGGNVETSQRLVDVLLEAFGMCAGSQGTMNNTIFGTSAFSYYETVCGGTGAGPGFAGVDAVHSHMTNTRITDPEVLEHRYPVRLERFGIRRGSGGAGRYRGGDGAVREITFLEPVRLSLLTQRRAAGPAGLDGGEAGAPGVQWIERHDGGRDALGAVAAADLQAGDRLVLLTPGGGGYGFPEAP
jgi:5-oxoprolinase (ATP-hydrolysing)